MTLPIALPLAPMLAKAVARVPAPDAVPGGYAYEPKWDGFRCMVIRDGEQVELASRGAKPLTRYFPEVVAAVEAVLPDRCVVDAEIIVRRGQPGHERLSWEDLSARIHPAASRIERLSRETPAELVCFDLLALADEELLAKPFKERRERLEAVFTHVGSDSTIHLTQLTTNAETARRWFEQFEGAGLDGVIAKPLQDPYLPGKRAMLKVKHSRTAEAVAIGYRIHKSGKGVGSLLLGLYDAEGALRPVGGIVAFTAARRMELIDELEPLVERDADGVAVTGENARSRFTSAKDVSFIALEPSRVVEVAFDQLEGHRFRHAVKFVRWRPDREPGDCRIEQVDRAADYDLAQVLR